MSHPVYNQITQYLASNRQLNFNLYIYYRPYLNGNYTNQVYCQLLIYNTCPVIPVISATFGLRNVLVKLSLLATQSISVGFRFRIRLSR